MGLVWEPLPKPRKGHEHEYADLLAKLRAGARRPQLLEWFANASEPAYTLLGAPRVGFDEAADAWLRARVEKSNRLAELDAIAQDMHGYHVLELLPPCEGFPVYSNYITDDNCDRYSFDAELLRGVSDALGTELCEAAYQIMAPEELADFATKLYVTADRYAAEHGLPDHVATIREPIFPEGTDGRRGHILYAAAKWCEYWSARGHGLAVTY